VAGLRRRLACSWAGNSPAKFGGRIYIIVLVEAEGEVTDQRTDGRRQSVVNTKWASPGGLDQSGNRRTRHPSCSSSWAEVVVVTKSALDAADPGLYRQREFITLVGGTAAAWRHAVGGTAAAMPVISATASCDLSDTRWRSQAHRHNLVERA
jgi:hypothetical protein